MDIIGLHYYNITHAKIILTEQNAWLIIYKSKNKIKMHEKYQYNRLDATEGTLSQVVLLLKYIVIYISDRDVFTSHGFIASFSSKC